MKKPQLIETMDVQGNRVKAPSTSDVIAEQLKTTADLVQPKKEMVIQKKGEKSPLEIIRAALDTIENEKGKLIQDRINHIAHIQQINEIVPLTMDEVNMIRLMLPQESLTPEPKKTRQPRSTSSKSTALYISETFQQLKGQEISKSQLLETMRKNGYDKGDGIQAALDKVIAELKIKKTGGGPTTKYLYK